MLPHQNIYCLVKKENQELLAQHVAMKKPKAKKDVVLISKSTLRNFEMDNKYYGLTGILFTAYQHLWVNTETSFGFKYLPKV